MRKASTEDLVITDHIRGMGKGNIFSPVCLSVHREGPLGGLFLPGERISLETDPSPFWGEGSDPETPTPPALSPAMRNRDGGGELGRAWSVCLEMLMKGLLVIITTRVRSTPCPSHILPLVPCPF